MDDDDPEDNFILSQSDVAPRPSNPSSSKHIQSSSGIITTLLEEQRNAHNRCPNFFLGTTDLTPHQQTCPTFQQQIQIHNFSNNPTWALAFAICPATQTHELNNLINNSPDNITPEMTLPTILITVSQWCLDTTTPTHATTTATSYTTND
jgi:hypothetical protein